MPLARICSTIFVLLLAVFLLLGGPGGGGGFTVNEDCDQNDLHGLVLVASVCGANVTNRDADEICDCKLIAVSSDPPQYDATFELNLGQAPRGYDVISRTAIGYTLYLSSSSSVIALRKNGERQARGVHTNLVDAAKNVPPVLISPQAHHVNYFLGSDPKAWVTDVPTFQKVKYPSVYPGIDVVYYANGAHLEHDFIVAPGANPDRIRLQFEGADRISADADGNLVLQTGEEKLHFKKPVLYQAEGRRSRKIAGRYRIHGDGTAGFEVGPYDPKLPLVIDPVVVFATYVGQQRYDAGMRVVSDPSGNVYAAGYTIDFNFRPTPGVLTTPPGAQDAANVLITKLAPDGRSAIYTTYIGGDSSDHALGLATDSAGNLYIAGSTASRDYPVTSSAYQRLPGNSANVFTAWGDCFVTKLNPAGNSLIYSTFIGSTGVEACTALAVDAAGNAYVTGSTTSQSFPRTEGAYQTLFNFGNSSPPIESFVAKLDASGSRLLYSTFVGGNGKDIASAIAVDSAGNAYVAGATLSTNFPTTAGAFQSVRRTNNPTRLQPDVFLLKLNPTGSELLYSTLLGGSDVDQAFGMALGPDGSAYVCGSTQSSDFPVTAQAYQTAFKGTGGTKDRNFDAGDAFAAKFNPTGRALEYATYVGGAKDDRALNCALDANGNLHLVGHTLSTDFPVTTDATQRTFGGTEERNYPFGDAFYARIGSTGRTLVYSTYFGGKGEDAAAGLYLDKEGNAFLTGATNSVDIAVTPGVVQRVYGGGPGIRQRIPFGDMFLVKFGEAPVAPRPAISNIVNAASRVNSTIAPGTVLVVQGVNLGPAQAITATLEPKGKLPTTLGQTRVLFDGVAAPIASVSAAAVTVVTPFALDGKSSTQITVEQQGVASEPVRMAVAATAPALFTADESGRGLVLALNEDGSRNSADTPAATGSIVTLYFTGGGRTDPAVDDGYVTDDSFPTIAGPVSVQFGDAVAEEVYFAGGIGGQVVGYSQIQLRLPAGAPSGAAAVKVKIGDAESQSGVVLMIAP
ncbi:MAG: SBBP repeat-containing protein [Acidobacteria bacterium]|nr:SBBP repeat-containing protein [Acidobacteriota bacterium]